MLDAIRDTDRDEDGLGGLTPDPIEPATVGGMAAPTAHGASPVEASHHPDTEPDSAKPARDAGVDRKAATRTMAYTEGPRVPAHDTDPMPREAPAESDVLVEADPYAPTEHAGSPDVARTVDAWSRAASDPPRARAYPPQTATTEPSRRVKRRTHLVAASAALVAVAAGSAVVVALARARAPLASSSALEPVPAPLALVSVASAPATAATTGSIPAPTPGPAPTQVAAIPAPTLLPALNEEPPAGPPRRAPGSTSPRKSPPRPLASSSPTAAASSDQRPLKLPSIGF
jgi:hypothetical protein